MPSFLKEKVYRNPALLKVAARAPRCFNPWCQFGPYYEQGSIVGCHSNRQRHGKGLNLKAHDLTAFMCHGCHDRLDGRAGDWSEDFQDRVFLEAFFATTLWLMQAEQLILNPKRPL